MTEIIYTCTRNYKCIVISLPNFSLKPYFLPRAIWIFIAAFVGCTMQADRLGTADEKHMCLSHHAPGPDPHDVVALHSPWARYPPLLYILEFSMPVHTNASCLFFFQFRIAEYPIA